MTKIDILPEAIQSYAEGDIRGKKLLLRRNKELMREFDTGATRDSDDGKLDYEAFLSSLTLKRYAEYMHGHRKQADGKLRAGDNWQKGIPFTAYMKSLWRHLIETWTLHRLKRQENRVEDRHKIEDALCAIIFNASGYLHELLKQTQNRVSTEAEQKAVLAPELFVPQHAGHEVGREDAA